MDGRSGHGLTVSQVLGVLFGLWGVFVGCRAFTDNSFITHLSTGRLLLDGTFPRADVYSFTARGEPWVIQSWLASVLYASLERVGGSPLVFVLIASLCAATAVCVWMLARPASGLVVRLAVAGLSVAIGSFAWSERPLMFGLLGLALTLLALERRIPAVVLVPALWVWANTHGSFPLALVICLAFAAGARLDGDSARDELRVAGFVAAGTLLAVIGPLGLEILTFPVHLLGRAEVLSHIIEWRSPSFEGLWARLFLLQVLVAIVGLVRCPRYRTAIPMVVAVALALLSARNVAVAAIVLVPGMAHSFTGIGMLEGDRRLRFGWVVVALLVLLGGARLSVALQEESWDYSLYSVDGLAWLDAQGLLGGDLRVVAPDYTGNLLEGVLGPDANVFIDDRYDMYPDAVVDDYLSLVQGDSQWRSVLAERQIDVVIWPSTDPLAQLLRESPEWTVAWQSSQWAIFCPRDGEGCSSGPPESSGDEQDPGAA